MKKKINIEKKLNFSQMISEVTAISLEHDLNFISEDNITGNLIISGKYKSNVASQIDEDFNYKIPVDISLTNHLDQDKSQVDITDFSYEVCDGNSLLCNVEILVDGVEILNDEREYIDDKALVDDRECDGDDILDDEKEIPKKQVEMPKLEDKEMLDSNDNDVDDIRDEADIESDVLEKSDQDESSENYFFKIDDDKEEFGTFIVYIIRQNETINSIIEKYNTNIEEIEKYNDIKDLSIGTKLIIPLLKDEDK